LRLPCIADKTIAIAEPALARAPTGQVSAWWRSRVTTKRLNREQWRNFSTTAMRATAANMARPISI
jgi:hypothetical protein